MPAVGGGAGAAERRQIARTDAPIARAKRHLFSAGSGVVGPTCQRSGLAHGRRAHSGSTPVKRRAGTLRDLPRLDGEGQDIGPELATTKLLGYFDPELHEIGAGLGDIKIPV